MLSNRPLFVETGDPVPWTKREGISYDPTQPIRLHGIFRDGFRASSDGYRFIRHDADPEFVDAVITWNGEEVADRVVN